jgi:hypothetical protein
MMRNLEQRNRHLPAALALATVLAGSALSCGCISKAKADAQARAAFQAGQQQALQQMQVRGPTVTFVGEVKHTLVPWSAGLTLAQAVLAAEFFGPTDPKVIVILRGQEAIQVDPRLLLGGEDILLQPRDVIEISR